MSASSGRGGMPMRRRLLLGGLALALVTLLGLGIPLAAMVGSAERRQLALRAERDAVRVASFADDALQAGVPLTGTAVARFVTSESGRTGGRIVVVNAVGGSELVSDAPDEPGRSFASRPEFVEALAGRVATGERYSRTLGTDLLFVAVPISSEGAVHGAVRITYPMSAVDSRVRRVWAALVAIGLTVLAVAALLASRFARAVTRPLDRLEEAVTAAGRGQLSIRATEEGPAEVRSLAASFNAMAGRLEELVGSQRAFVADASHQLRTPLAALRLRLENLQDGSGGDAVAPALVEVARLGRLVDGLLSLARADATAPAGETVCVSDVAVERAEVWADLAAEQGVRVTQEISREVGAVGGADRLAQVLDNLIENALAVSPRGGAVHVSAETDGHWATVRVADEGPGLSDAERERAFDRFWRGTRNEAEGTGLGLAIARGLVQADGGEIRLDPAPGGGIVAVVRLRGANLL